MGRMENCLCAAKMPATTRCTDHGMADIARRLSRRGAMGWRNNYKRALGAIVYVARNPPPSFTSTLFHFTATATALMSRLRGIPDVLRPLRTRPEL
jgi:hypothetical protein